VTSYRAVASVYTLDSEGEPTETTLFAVDDEFVLEELDAGQLAAVRRQIAAVWVLNAEGDLDFGARDLGASAWLAREAAQEAADAALNAQGGGLPQPPPSQYATDLATYRALVAAADAEL